MSRVPLLDPDEVPEPETYDAYGELPDEYTESRHVGENRFQNSPIHRAMAHNEPAHALHTEAYLSLWNGEKTGLVPRETELVIITSGRAHGAPHEWNSHIQNALTMGLSEEEIVAIADGEFDELPDNEAALARYVTAMANMEVTDELHDELAEHYDVRTIVGIQVLAGYYALCAVVIEAIGAPLAQPGEGFEHLAYDELVA